MRFKNVLFPFLLSTVCVHAYAENQELKSQVRFIVPSGTNTVAEAAEYFIKPHKYTITYTGAAPAEARDIANQPIPEVIRRGSIMSIEQAILSMLHEDQALIIDTDAKLISFGLVAKERGLK
jgi:hypothetical protein